MRRNCMDGGLRQDGVRWRVLIYNHELVGVVTLELELRSGRFPGMEEKTHVVSERRGGEFQRSVSMTTHSYH